MKVYKDFKSPTFFHKTEIIAYSSYLIWILITILQRKDIINNTTIIDYISYIVFIPILVKFSNFFREEEHSKSFCGNIDFNITGISWNNAPISWRNIEYINFQYKDFYGARKKHAFWSFRNHRSSGCNNPIEIRTKDGTIVKGYVELNFQKDIKDLEGLFTEIQEEYDPTENKFIFTH